MGELRSGIVGAADGGKWYVALNELCPTRGCAELHAILVFESRIHCKTWNTDRPVIVIHLLHMCHCDTASTP